MSSHVLRPNKHLTNYSRNKPTDFVLHVKDPLILFKKIITCPKILLNIPIAKFQENVFTSSRGFTCMQMNRHIPKATGALYNFFFAKGAQNKIKLC